MHNFIKKSALEIGFDACGIAAAEELRDDAVFLKSWLDAGKNGEMHYLERNFEKRINPQIMVSGCKSVVVVLLNYFPEQQQPSNAPRIARYAYSETDYHSVIKQKLQLLENTIVEKYGEGAVNKNYQHSFVDSAPVLERRWAQRAGLGWIGRHTQLIAPGIGSYCFIGVLMLNVETKYDRSVENRCGKCTRCVDACPTKALNGRSLDARLCISYQTIEKKTEVDEAIKPKLSGCTLGCDICAEVCPWNRKWAKPHQHEALKPVSEILEWEGEKWSGLSEEEFNRMFKYSAVKRAGYEKMKQNIAIITKTKNREK
ncbi:MAG: tRNA epoxyqueuosine(34) reductase QueG [Paludibacter sp.]|nr:tRNA epoxyqueuosine(34) reductase QueG [Paludibacter sp.]